MSTIFISMVNANSLQPSRGHQMPTRREAVPVPGREADLAIRIPLPTHYTDKTHPMV